MSDIPARLVKELRDLTGAGMMDCKRALQETGGDSEAARRLLREWGVAQAGKRAGRTTTEGKVGYRLKDEAGTLVAVGSETEPVANNDEFFRFTEKVLDVVEQEGPQAVSKLEDERLELIAKLGENIEIRGATRFQGEEGDTLAAYIHPPANKIGVLVHGRGPQEAARELAMHISFAAPRWTSRAEVPQDVVAQEREIFGSADEVKSKPEQVRERIVEGMLNKRFFAESPGGVLLEQAWIHDGNKTTGQALEEAGFELLEFARYSLAE
jgi:elongation factor Ts